MECRGGRLQQQRSLSELTVPGPFPQGLCLVLRAFYFITLKSMCSPSQLPLFHPLPPFFTRKVGLCHPPSRVSWLGEVSGSPAWATTRYSKRIRVGGKSLGGSEFLLRVGSSSLSQVRSYKHPQQLAWQRQHQWSLGCCL